MNIRNFMLAAAIAGFASPVFAQTATPTTIDCNVPANAENKACLDRLGTDVTAFAPLAAPLAGVLGLGLLAGGGGSTTSTTSTTGTN